MLELAKIARDIDNMGRERAELSSAAEDEFRRADEVVSSMVQDLDFTRGRLTNARTSWLVANFDEAPDTVHALPECPARHAVVAVDGSQIAPDRHEAAPCYLINAASVILYYGTGDRPEARTAPKLYYREQDLFVRYGGQTVRIADKLLGVRRTLAESAELEDAIRRAAAKESPIVALWDGSLIRWSLQNEPPDYRANALRLYLQTFDTARELGVPIAGYISDPGSKDFVNSMKVMLCDMEKVDCEKCPHQSDPPAEKPCDTVGRLHDAAVFNRRLESGRRSVLFTSGSTILREYGEHEILAFYLNAGWEIARIEVPKWVAANRGLLELVHAVCFDQASKGRGYPVALAEAHERAVIRGPERAAFYDMVERSFIKHAARVSHSLKRISKGH